VARGRGCGDWLHDPAHHLDNPVVISAYLAEVRKTGNRKLMVCAIQTVARAGRMAKVVCKTGQALHAKERKQRGRGK
jgi:DNA-binding phage protein